MKKSNLERFQEDLKKRDTQLNNNLLEESPKATAQPDQVSSDEEIEESENDSFSKGLGGFDSKPEIEGIEELEKD